MAFLTWKAQYETGVSRFDQQHKQLVERINRLNDAMMEGKGKEQLGAILEDLVAYTRSHFRDEEAMMQQHGFPKLHEHRREHEALTGKVMEFKEKFDQGLAGVSIQVMGFLRDWLTHHIHGSDMQYASFFQEKGVS